MPHQIARLVLAVLIVASLVGGRSLVANVTDGTQHVVAPGETLGAIAARYGTTVDQLVAINELAEPDRLADGQILRLPAPVRTVAVQAPAGATAATGAGPLRDVYIVQSGDTLSGIAKSLGITLKVLLEANDLTDPNRLTVGQKLTVPAAGAAASAPPAASAPAASAQPSSTAARSAPPNGPANEAAATLDRLATRYGVDRALVRALAWSDADGRPRALDAPGGIGHLAVTDRTFEYVEESIVKHKLDRANPAENAEAGIAYASAMLKWGGDELKGLAGFLQGPGSVTANGIRPTIEQQVRRVQALRDRLATSIGAPSATPTAGLGAGAGPAAAQVPTTRSAPSDRMATLAARAIGAARGVAGPAPRIGVTGRNLVTGDRLAIAADETFPAASVGKLALLVELYRQSEGGTIALTDVQRADARSMIVASDNDAANRLLEQLSVRGVNANLQALGLIATRLGNPFGLAHAVGAPANVTTPADMGRLLELLAGERLVSPAASREMRALLLQAQDGSKLRRGLPADARIAHKSGWYDGVANDVGIVSHGATSYVISVFTEGIPDAETANQTIAAIARVVHTDWGPAR